MLGYVVDDVFLRHQAPNGHPERAARVEAASAALRGHATLAQAELVKPVAVRSATVEELGRVHTEAHVARVHRELTGSDGWLDPDTYFSADSLQVATLAAGAACELALQVWRGECRAGLALVRPPGHHATADRAMGFCIFNNIAIAARAVQAAGAKRVAIVDWDVHHGNGTQDIFWDDPSVLYVSLHQHPYYPGSGSPTEMGGAHALGATLNIGLPAGVGDDEYLAAFDHLVVPALAEFAPEVVFISAGFDAFVHDPIAAMQVTAAGFGAMAARLMAFAARACNGRCVAVLEGGYDLQGLELGVTQVWEAMVASVTGQAQPVAVHPLPFWGPARAAMLATATAHHAAPVAAGWASQLLHSAKERR